MVAAAGFGQCLVLIGATLAGVSGYSYTEVEATEVTKGQTHPLVGRNSYHHLITGLTGGDAYNVRVSAYNDLGFGATQLSTPSKLIPGATVPQVPSNVEVTGVTSRTVAVAWDAPVSDGGEAIDSYVVEWDSVKSFTSRCGDKIEIQRLEISRPTEIDCTGTCEFMVGMSVGGVAYDTGCLVWDISAGDFETAVKTMVAASGTAGSSDISIARFGDETAAWGFGYAHTISFEGTGVQTDVELFDIVEVGDSGCESGDLLSSSVSMIPIQDGQGTSAACEASHLEPLGRIETGSASTSFVIENLEPGIPMFVRVSAQNALGNSPAAVMGYPLSELSTTPAAVPEPLEYVGLFTDDDGLIHVEWAPPPKTKLEGNNGKAILGYDVDLATRIVEEQLVTVQGDLGMFTQGQYKLQLGADVTKCIDVFASATQMEHALEQLEALDDVSVQRSDIHHGYQYHIHFNGELKENGNIDELMLGPACAGEGSAFVPEGEPVEDIVQILTVEEGQSGSVPEIIEITTSSDIGSALSGSFHLSYDYTGDFTQAVAGAAVTVEKGSRIVSTTIDLRPLLRRGQSVKIGDEILTIDALDDFTASELPLSSYHVVGADGVSIYIMDTVVGFAGVSTDDTSVTPYDVDFTTTTPGLVVGEFIQLDGEVYAVRDIDSSLIKLGEPSDHTQSKQYVGATDNHVLIFKRKKVEVKFDEGTFELDSKIESLPGIGSVDVSRIGPDIQDSFTWSVTFTSSTSNGACTMGSPQCLTVENTASLLEGTNPEVAATITREGISPSFGRLASSTKINNGAFEVQTIRIAAEADDLDGKFVISFPKAPPMYTSGNSGAAVSTEALGLHQWTLGTFVRPTTTAAVTLYYSVSSEDLKSTLESFSTIGIVDVTRRAIEFGYEWDVSFKSNAGDLPLLTVDGALLKGTNPTAKVVEVTKGSYLDHHLVLMDLPSTSQVYAAKMSAFNEVGSGLDTLVKQDAGEGVVPLHITNSRQPSAIDTDTLVLEALSSSEYMVQFEPPSSNGEPITKYLLEWTSGSDFGTPAEFAFKIVNSHVSHGVNDTAGWFTLSYAQQTTTILDHDVSAEDLEDALNSLSALRMVQVSREPQYHLDDENELESGFQWHITFTENVGERELWDADSQNGLTIVENGLYSITTEGTVDLTTTDRLVAGTSPPDYGYMAIDATEDCGKHITGFPTRHQKLRFSTADGDATAITEGSYVLSFDGEKTDCISFNATGEKYDASRNALTTANSLKVALEALDNVAEVTVKATDGSFDFPYDYDIVFHGTDYEYPKMTWPLLKVVSSDFGAGDCEAFSESDVHYDLQSMKEFEPCSNGNNEIQIVVAEGDSELSGSFTIVYSGLLTDPIPISSTAGDMQSFLNAIPEMGDVSVSKVSHGDYGFAWIVTFETNFNPDFMVTIDEFVGGINGVVNIYQGAIISAGAEDPKYAHQEAVSGDFRVHVGQEVSEALAHDCTDARILEALHKLDSFARVDVLNGQNNALVVTMSVAPEQGDTVLSTATDLTKTLAIGETIKISDDVATEEFVLSLINATSITLDAAITLTGTVSADVTFGLTSKSKQLLPGWFTIIPSGTLVTATVGNTVIQITSDLTFSNSDVLSISGNTYTITNVADDFITLDAPYEGTEVNLASPETGLFLTSNVEIETSFSMENLLSPGDNFWIQDSTFVVVSTSATSLLVDGTVSSEAVGAAGRKTGNGHEKHLLFKSHTSDLNTFNVVPEANWRGAGAYLKVQRPNAVPPNQFVLGNLPEIQTIALRSDAAIVDPTQVTFAIRVNLPACSTKVQQCTPLLPPFEKLTKETTVALDWGASSEDVKDALQDLSFLDKVQVNRSPADGEAATATTNFGFVYSITFLGDIAATQLIHVEVDLADSDSSAVASIHINRKRPGTSTASFSSSYLSLTEDTEYMFRLSAANAKGWGGATSMVPVKTPLLGRVPSKPTSVAVLNQGKDWLQPFWSYPTIDGGLPVTSYKLEVDDSPTFFKGSAAYQQVLLSIEHEVQDVYTDFDPDDGFGTAGGTFALTFGGEVTGDLNFDCSEKDMADAVSQITDVDAVGVNPIKVVRSPKGRGYRWRITFTGVRGNLNLLQANGNKLTGNNPLVSVGPVSDGKADITPGSFTPEVQSIVVRSLSQANGNFVIDFEGAMTDPLPVLATANQVKAALEQLATIKTVTVDRWEYDPSFGLVIWDVTFSHMYHERIQGVGDLGLMRVTSDTGTPLEGNSIVVEVMEKIKGTVPFLHAIEDLKVGIPVYFRVSAYNAAGFGPTSDVAQYTPTLQPGAPQLAKVTVDSRTSLALSWEAPVEDGGSAVSGYKVEWFSTSPTSEQQMITTSSEKGIDEVQAVRTSAKDVGIGGFFKLSFKGEETEDIAFDAPAEGGGSVKEKLERLSVVGKVSVERAHSKNLIHGLLAKVDVGESLVELNDVPSSHFAQNDLLWLSGMPFRVNDLDDGDQTITLGNVDDYTTSENFPDSSADDVPVFKWAYGYEWSVTFTSGHVGPQPLLEATPSNNWRGTNPTLETSEIIDGLQPMSGFFSLTMYDPVQKLHHKTSPIPHDASAKKVKDVLEHLVTASTVSVARSINGNGFNWAVTWESDLGDLELLSADDSQLNGPSAKVSVSELLPGTEGDNYGLELLNSNSLDYVIGSEAALISGTEYRVRVAARNDNGYGEFTSTEPLTEIPRGISDPPSNVKLVVLNDHELKVVFNQPADNGGAAVDSYRIEWDIDPDFKNIDTSGYTHVLSGSGSGPFFYNIPISSASNWIERYVRVLAHNDRGWSVPQISSPASAVPSLQLPGVPQNIKLEVTSHVGLVVSWETPSTHLAVYGGDGGAPITSYVVEWDISESFDSDAQRYFLDLPADELQFFIGGRNPFTGVNEVTLQSGVRYYVRVGAFNSVGAGTLSVATPASTVPTLQLPSAPISSAVMPIDETSLKYSFDYPEFDGGASMRGVLVEWGLSEDLEWQIMDSARLPLEREVQNVGIDVVLANEEQWIQETVEVTNERQTVRTKVQGVDEIQVIEITADTVTEEIQTITTSSVDEDEIQTLTISGSADHVTDTERQIIRSTTDEVAEVQRLTVTQTRVNEIQVVSVYYPGTNVWTGEVPVDWSGTFKLAFITTDCEFCRCPDGNETDDFELCSQVEESMYINPGLTDVNDVTGTDDSNSGFGIRHALMSMANIGTDNVEVVRTVDSNHVFFEITFNGTSVLGNVPDLLIASDSISKVDQTTAQTRITTDFCPCRISGDSEDQCSGDCVSDECTDGDGCAAPAYRAGAQPAGVFALEYTCEDYSDPWSLDESTVSGVDEYEADNDGVSDICLTSALYTSYLMEFNILSEDVSDKLEAMPNVNPEVLVTRARVATVDDVGYTWLITFQNNHGDLPNLGCVTDALTSFETCASVEEVAGSMLSGTFSVHDDSYESDNSIATALLSSNHELNWAISAADMKTALEAAVTSDGDSAFGTVNVVRTAYYTDSTGKWSGGFEWAITFLDRIGNIPKLKTTYTSIATKSANEDVDSIEVQNGNELYGAFSLTFREATSAVIFGCVGMYWTDPGCEANLTASAIEVYINNEIFNSVGAVTVTRNDDYYDKAGGKQWDITFVHESVGADVPNLEPTFDEMLGSQATVDVEEKRAGNQLIGTFRLRLNNYDTGELQYDASEEQMENLLNALPTIRPSKVAVTRTTEWSSTDQVRAYTWTVTFKSSTWHDPTDHSTDDEGPAGNWGLDSPAGWGDVWESGYSKAWGRNVGDVNAFTCLQSSLSTSLDGYDKDCVVQEHVKGTAPVGGTFAVGLDTRLDVQGLHWTVNTANDGSESAINVHGNHETEVIAHNAVPSRELSGSDGTSVEELLEALPNVGDIAVSRSAVDPATGGYSWTITFLRDGDTCEEFESESGLCNAPGNVPRLSADHLLLVGNSVAIDVYDAEDADSVAVASTCVHGKVLRGKFEDFKVTGDSQAPGLPELVWNAGKSDVKAYLEAQMNGRTVEVDGRWIHSKYGSVEWLVRFSENPGQTPPGTGDIADFEVTSDAQLDVNMDGLVQVLESQKGSTGLSGTFTIDVSSPMGPVVVNFDEDETRLARKLNEMSTVGAVDVRRYKYPSPSTGGWGAESVGVDDTRGGYEWKVRYLSNPGSYDGLTFPPGAGDVETIQTADGTLGGDAVQVEVVEGKVGSKPLGGTFSLSYDSAPTSQLPYSASGLEMSDELESLPTIGEVTASRNTRVASLVPGVFAVVKRDAASIQLVTTDNADDTVADPSMTLRRYVTNGDMLRIGGESGGPDDFVGLQGSNGDYQLAGDFTVLPFSPVVSTSESQTEVVTAGETIRLAGETYKIERTGTEKQVLTISSQITMGSDSGLGFYFTLSRNGYLYDEDTACIDLWSTGEADIQAKLNDMPFFDDSDVLVTSAEDTTAGTDVYFIYFEGLTAQGDVAQLGFGDCSDSGSVSSHVDIATEIEGGHVEIQQIVLATGSGEIEGSYFKLKYDGETTSECIDWGASPEEVKDALGGLTGIGGNADEEIIVTRTGSGNSLAEIQQIVLTSDVPVQEGASAGYRLRWNHNEQDAITDCISYHATSDDVQAALDAMHCASGACSPSCDGPDGICDNSVLAGHIRVTREGDGSSTWGYGYTLAFTFEGPIEGGNSRVLSNVPELEVVYATDDANQCTPVEAGNPTFQIDTLRDGAPAYTYFVHFVGKLFSNVNQITVEEKGTSDDSSCSFVHDKGSVSDVWVGTVQDGGSRETYTVDISNPDAPITAGQLVFTATIDGISYPSACADWDDAADIETKMNTALNNAGFESITVTKISSKTVYASSISAYNEALGSHGFAYEFTFLHEKFTGGIVGFTAAEDSPLCTALTAEKGTSIVSTSKLIDGSLPTNELVLSEGFKSIDDVSAVYPAYKVAPVFSVLGDVTDVSTLSIFDLSGPILGLTFNISDSDDSFEFGWDVSDFVIEEKLRILLDSNEVTVTRHLDAVNAPNGFVHTIYGGTSGMLSGLSINYDDSSSPEIDLAVVPNDVVCTATDQATCTFTGDSLPLGLATDSATSAIYVGQSDTLLPIYRVSGFSWDIKFDSNLGDLSPLVLIPEKLQGDTSSSRVSELFPGILPAFTVVPNLDEGIQHFFRARTVTSEGFSEASSVMGGTAMGNPEGVHHVAIGHALHVDEVQTVSVAAKHIDEVQTIQTSADFVPEVQLVRTSADEGATLTNGNFALRWPEIQTIRISSENSITGGTFALSIQDTTKFSSNSQSTATATTICMDWDLDEDSMTAALDDALSVGDVKVSRTQVEWSSGEFLGDTGYGYEYTIAFVSSRVAGNMPTFVHARTGSDAACDDFSTSGGAAVAVSIATKTTMPFGTDIEIQQVSVAAAKPLSRGQYKIQFTLGEIADQSTECIEFDADAGTLKARLEQLSNIDSVYVERSGDGSQLSEYGYSYNIFFDGNLLINADPDGDGTADPDLPLLEILMDEVECTDFKTLEDNVLTTDGVDATVTAADDCDICNDGGLDLSVSITTAASLKVELERLPASLVGYAHTSQSLLDDQGGQSWTMSFAAIEGDIDEMYCSLSSDTDASGAACVVETIVDGNVLGGTFLLSGAGPLAFDATSAEMKAVIESVADMETVTVTRSEPDGQLGYVWSVTFTSNQGDIAPLVPTNSLTGTRADIQIEEVERGNYLSGSYTLSYLGQSTATIPMSATAEEFKAILQTVNSLGLIAVTRSEIDSEGGSDYTVTFRDTSNPGDVDALVPNFDHLLGVGAVVVVSEETKGSEATATAMWLSFESSVDGNGDPIRSYDISWDTSSQFDANVRSFELNMQNDVDSSDKFYREQRIVTGSQSARPSFEAQPRQNEIQKLAISGSINETFRLSFRGMQIDTDITLGTTTLAELEAALQRLYPVISSDGIEITSPTSSSVVEDGTEFLVEFLNEPGLLPLLELEDESGDAAVAIDRETPGDASYRKEIQTLQCDGSSGSFTVSFDGSDPATVNNNVDLDTFKALLESLSTLDAGGITIITSSTEANNAVEVCSGELVYLVFNKYLGNAPELTYVTTGLTSTTFAGAELVRGVSPQSQVVSGYFKLSLNGEETSILDVGASADRVRNAVEALPSVTTASVDVGMGKEEIGLLQVISGQQYLTCPSSGCGFEYGLFGFPGDWIFLESVWYTIVAPTEDTAEYWPALSSERLYIGDATGQPTSYRGEGGDSVRAFIWSMGYEWTIRTLAHNFANGIIPPFVPSFHALAPAGAQISALASDCNKCVYIPSANHVGLTPGELYFAKVVARNQIGPNENSEIVNAVPRAIPGPPTQVQLAVVSGSEMQVYFSPPSLPSNAVIAGYNDDISRYTVQWSTSMLFRHGTPLCNNCVHSLTGDVITTENLVGLLYAGTTFTISNDDECVLTVSSIDTISVTVETGHGCASFVKYDVESSFAIVHYDIPPVEVTEIFQSPPLSYLITGLNADVEYYVRVAARNSVLAQSVDPTGTPPDNTQWSAALSDIPEDKVPSAPVLVEMFSFSADKVQIYITPPLSDGMGLDGAAVTQYTVEWSTHSSYSSSTSIDVDVERDDGCPLPDADECNLPELTAEGSLMFIIDDLDMHVPVFVKVYAVNAVGPSLPTMAINSGIAPLSSPWEPALASTSTIQLDASAPIDSMDIEWSLPANNGGSQITGYRVEWWSAESRAPEVQVVTLSWEGNTVPADADCKWTAAFNGADSQSMDWDISPTNLRNALMNMKQGDTGDLVFGDIEVSRFPVNTDHGFTWRITFLGLLSEGNIPELELEAVSCGSEPDLNFNIYQLVAGKSLASFDVSGKNEVQVLETATTGGDVHGFFRMKFQGSAWSNYLSASASDTEVEESLESLLSTGGITVERSTVQTGNSYAWTVTFHNNVDDIEAIVVDTAYLLPAAGDATMVVHDGDNLVDSDGERICEACVVGEKAVEYDYVDVGADTYAYRVEDLVPGKSYYAAVSARNDVSGYGARKAVAQALTLPLQKPGMPTGVSPAVHYGDAERLEITFGAPLSDGGSPVLYYLVQWDPTPTFDNPGSEIFNCPTHPKRATWVITMARDSGSSDLASGYFQLTLSQFNADYTTDPIPFDAVAMGDEEVGGTSSDSKVHCIFEGHDHCTNNRVETSGSLEKKIEQLNIIDDVVVSRSDGDTTGTYSWTITFRDDGDDVSITSVDLYELLPSDTTWSMDIQQKVVGEVFPECTGTQVAPTTGGLTKGQYYYVRAFAYNEVGFGLAQRSVYPEKPMVIPGAPTAVTLEVVSSYQLRVVFNPPDDDGGDTVTQYIVEWSTSSTFETVSSAEVIELSGGAPFFKTIGSLDEPLTQGEYYWIRLSCCNSQGCSAFPQASSPPSLNPHEAPSAPTSVMLGVTSETMLTVSFFAPTNDGGDDVSSYVVEWDTSSEFNSLDLPPHKDSYEVQDASAHNSYTIESLTESRSYFVRVFAKNSAGAGTPQDASPSFGVPVAQVPGKPHSLIAATGTESGELYLSWQRPFVPNHGIPCYGTETSPLECPDRSGLGDYAADGGAAINRYRVQFIQTSDYSVMSSDNTWTDAQNEITCDSYAAQCSTSLGASDGIAAGSEYYLRVQTYNSQGYGSACSTGSIYCPGSGSLVSATAKA